MLLTGVNVLLRGMSMLFQVYLAGRIGPAGLGLLQLILSVGGFATVSYTHLTLPTIIAV